MITIIDLPVKSKSDLIVGKIIAQKLHFIGLNQNVRLNVS